MQLSAAVYAFLAATGFLATGVFFATGFLATFAVFGLSALTFFTAAAFFGLSFFDFFGAATFGLLGVFFADDVATDLTDDFFVIFLAGDLADLSPAAAFLILAAGGALAFFGVFLPAAGLAAFGFF